MTITLPQIHFEDIDRYGNNADMWWMRPEKGVYATVWYRAVRVEHFDWVEVRPMTTEDIAKWDLWDWFGPEDFDDDGELITEIGDYEFE